MNIIGKITKYLLSKRTYGFYSSCPICRNSYHVHGTLDKLSTTHTCSDCGTLIVFTYKFIDEIDDYMVLTDYCIKKQELDMFKELIGD